MKLDKVNFIEKRKLKYSGDYAAEAKSRYAEYCSERGQVIDAVDLLIELKDREGVARYKQDGIRDGNYFLYQYICKLTKTTMNEEELQALAAVAREKGLLRYALAADNRVEQLKQAEESAPIQEPESNTQPKARKRARKNKRQ